MVTYAALQQAFATRKAEAETDMHMGLTFLRVLFGTKIIADDFKLSNPSQCTEQPKYF